MNVIKKMNTGFFLLLMALVFSSACASEKSAQKTQANSQPADGAGRMTKDEGAKANDGDDDDDDDEIEALEMPHTYAEMSVRLEFLCPAPLFSFDKPFVVQATPSQSFEVLGSTMRAQETVGATLLLGVIGAIKDPTDETRRNLKRAERAFEKAGVHAVVVNGDVAEDEDLDAVFKMMGEVFHRPVFAHSGNIEWSASFNHAWEAAAAEHPHLFNMNWIRVVEFGEHTLLTLPGYFNHRFMRSGACHYESDDVEVLLPIAKAAVDRGQVVVLSSHGPPLGKKKGALDVIDEGDHVGDPSINNLIAKSGIQVGLFSHILEAGGRALVDLEGVKQHALQKRGLSTLTKTLFVNVGSASAGGWEMNDGKQNNGMAAIVAIEKDGARVQFLKLR